MGTQGSKNGGQRHEPRVHQVGQADGEGRLETGDPHRRPVELHLLGNGGMRRMIRGDAVKGAIQKSLEKISVGRTTILVAHRLSTIVKADKIFVLEDGRVVESGTHRELLAKAGAYEALWKVQTGAAA